MQTSVYVNSSYKPFISNMGKVHKAIEVKQLFCAEGFYWRDDEFFFLSCKHSYGRTLFFWWRLMAKHFHFPIDLY